LAAIALIATGTPSRGWEPLEFEEMSQTAQQMNREPGMMKFSGIIGQAFSGWDAN
jgi:hypothetical protein